MYLINTTPLNGNLCIEKGIVSGCPFCKAINADFPKIGDKVKILSDFKAGLIGEVTEVEQEEIIVHFLYDPKEYQYRVLLKYDLVEPSPFLVVPSWAPAIPLKRAAKLHDLVINFCQKSLCNSKWKFGQSAFSDIVVHIWFKRLPIEPPELWRILEAHGIPSKWKNHSLKLFGLIKEVLTVYHFVDTGRNYKMKKRTSPFSTEGN
jgi:hypothetical protein